MGSDLMAALSPPVSRPIRMSAGSVGRLAYRALLQEVTLTPKPGLVDRANTGAHDDMDLATFFASARAIAPWFGRFLTEGGRTAGDPAPLALGALRRLGMACEQAMFAATGGVNTHKGSIFAFGLLCGAAGRLLAGGRPFDRVILCREVEHLCEGLVARDLSGRAASATAGERLFHHHGMTGARGEAASGFATVRHHALPALFAARAAGAPPRMALFQAFLTLLAVNPDTNLVARGGLPGLAHVQARARRLLDDGGWAAPGFLKKMADFDQDLIARRLSPGGSADLLAVTWFLAYLPPVSSLRPSVAPASP
ncbi:MAG: triphosphoribosyl-dephospho-CoA synthase CitG [Telmatospirillum sp.]|nr:triphosphoribosyl-dephospho-CoA synthase CitG [Telmatospirillum sp.]